MAQGYERMEVFGRISIIVTTSPHATELTGSEGIVLYVLNQILDQVQRLEVAEQEAKRHGCADDHSRQTK